MKVVYDFKPTVAPSRRKRYAAAGEGKRTPSTAPPKARQLALAHHLNDMLQADPRVNIASIARETGVSTARISQILDLTLLAPGIQEGILDGSLAIGSHALRRLAGIREWERQKQLLEKELCRTRD